MFEISKKIEFDYGHRVHTQVLNKLYSIDEQCACRHLHGHRGVVTVTLRGKELEPDTQMLTDFKHLNWFKKFVDEFLDHKMMLDVNDPNLKMLFPKIANGEIRLKSNPDLGDISLVDLGNEKEQGFDSPEKEIYEGLVLVPFCPTSENIAKWFHSIIKKKMISFLTIESLRIDFSETPKSNACYYE